MHRIRTYCAGLSSALVLCFTAMSTLACTPQSQDQVVFSKQLAPSKIVDSNREGRLANFPCEGCHDKIEAAAPPQGPRKHRGLEFEHFDGAEACFTCHDEDNRDSLRLLANKTVSFNDVSMLCGQCHSEKLRDWKIGAHGKSVGGWAGVRNRLTCTDCHDPHAPGRPIVQALPPPPFPPLGIPKGDH